MSKILVSNCDGCGDTRVPVNFSRGEKMCKICDPEGFEVQARIDIDAWLRGDPEGDRALGLA